MKQAKKRTNKMWPKMKKNRLPHVNELLINQPAYIILRDGNN